MTYWIRVRHGWIIQYHLLITYMILCPITSASCVLSISCFALCIRLRGWRNSPRRTWWLGRTPQARFKPRSFTSSTMWALLPPNLNPKQVADDSFSIWSADWKGSNMFFVQKNGFKSASYKTIIPISIIYFDCYETLSNLKASYLFDVLPLVWMPCRLASATFWSPSSSAWDMIHPFYLSLRCQGYRLCGIAEAAL